MEVGVEEDMAAAAAGYSGVELLVPSPPILVGFHLLLAVMVELLVVGLEEEEEPQEEEEAVAVVVTLVVVVVVMMLMGLGQSAEVVVHLRYLQ
jgi:hypothetical protein